jgi:hypothetical protein
VNGAQTLVGLGGTGLVAANFLHSSDRTALSSAIFSGSNLSAGHQAFLDLAFEGAFVVVATVLAGLNDSLGVAMVVAIIALWVLWFINTGLGGSKSTHSGIATTSTMSGTVAGASAAA